MNGDYYVDSATKVKYCIEDAEADRERQGYLSQEDLQLLADLHELNAQEIAQVFKYFQNQKLVKGKEQSKLVEKTTWHKAKKPTKKKSKYWQGTVPATAMDALIEAATHFPLLNRDEEVKLGRRISQGMLIQEDSLFNEYSDEHQEIIEDARTARNELVAANIRLVISIAKRYQNHGLELEDLIHEGFSGLFRAADKFDHSMGFKFSTYATNWIRQSIVRGIADRGRTVRLPVYVHEKISAMSAARNRLQHQLNNEPTVEEIAQELDLEIEEVVALSDISREIVSLDAAIGQDGADSLVQFLDLYEIDVADSVLEALTRTLIWEIAEEVMPERTSAMLKYRYGYPHGEEKTLQEIGDIYGISRERVRQLIRDALKDEVFRHLIDRVTKE